MIDADPIIDEIRDCIAMSDADVPIVSDRETIDRYITEQRNPLRVEMRAAVLAMTFPWANRLHEMGVPAAYLMGEEQLGLARVEVLGAGLWQPCEAGREMLVIPVDDEEQMIDLVAFDPADPDAWCLRTGAAWTLGEAAVWRAMSEQSWGLKEHVLHLTPNPLEWLRAGGEGACVVDWGDYARGMLRELNQIEVATPALAQRLRLQLAVPVKIPDVTVRRRRRSHAA